jgi:group II intron reverse transcriptase/maturase
MRKRKKDIKERQLQMNFVRECNESSHCEVKEAVVHRLRHGAVSPVWLSACKEERALTAGIMEEIASLSNLQKAYVSVKKNGGSGGVDGMDMKGFRKWARSNMLKLQKEVLEGVYEVSPVLGIEIPKPQGGYRQLGIPTLRDRLVQQAIHQVLNQRYEQVFSEYSYGFRPARSAHDALLQSCKYIEQGRNYVVDLDLEKFFDKVNHDRLMWLLSTRIGDEKVLELIHRMVKAGMLQGGLLSHRIAGTPQGGPLSPLLSNIVLDELDKELERRGYSYVRYADDVKIFASSRQQAQRIMAKVVLFIEETLKLKVNRDKSRVCKGHELTFLGHSLLKDGTLGLGKGSEQKFKSKLKAISSRRRGVSIERVIKELRDVTQGWLVYYRQARMQRKIEQIDGWLRRRLRCFRLKQCKRAIGIVRFLRKEGVEESLAWRLALSGKGWWRLSNSPASSIGMNKLWFARMGYQSLTDHYNLVKRFEL